MRAKQLIEDLIHLQKKYGNTPRASVTSERFENIVVKSNIPIDKVDFLDVKLREPLIEHVGHLPIIASFLHPHIEHTSKVDLGRSLIMLSVHDIGETVTGDVFSHSKSEKDAKKEFELAVKLVHPDIKVYFLEFEEGKTLDAKYAKAIDSMAPILTDLALEPEVTTKRFKDYNLTADMAEEAKRKHVEWDHVLNKIFDVLILELRSREQGRPTVPL